MSYSGEANDARFNAPNIFAASTQQARLIFGHVFPLSLAARIGLISLSTSATDGRAANRLALRIGTDARLNAVWDGGNNNTSMTDGTLFTLNAWQDFGLFFPPMDGTTDADIKFYAKGNSQVKQIDIGSYGATNYVSACAGDGTFAETNHKAGYISVYDVADIAEADALVAELRTKAPAIVGTPLFDWPFATAAPAGFAPLGAISIDAEENPDLILAAAADDAVIMTY